MAVHYHAHLILFLLLLGLDPQCPLEHIDQILYFNLV
jgi:hypothetical protein